ncbi:NADPH-dependent FMN reductase [Marihabitans asiaticum]|uniref:NAD(P)H-dependent FMN reductase n=1 Tax=Marihabitans asiaticum TaxID=415218 RepID=A0A560WDQ4_9MICO|nr:NAD(P)H-dependent oxidoreductase [Marihabitans asiaticum]TWD15807.1 NAD(P)H-dependent FMN reductase [Marihabitans asiaticum]
MKIAVILGSTRPGRVGEQVGRWVFEQVSGRDDAEYELVDLADYDLDLLNEPTVPGAAKRQYENEKTRRWSETIDAFDGYVFVTPEYNHGVPAALKNAFDVIFPEWTYKCVALVSYGSDGGVRAVEHWRQICANAQMHVVRGQLSMSTFTDFDGGTFTPQERRTKELSTLMAQLVKWSTATATLRS